MGFIQVFRFLLENFKRQNIDFALIGGLALQAVGIIRATCDIDLLILSQNKDKVKEIMSKAGYELIMRARMFSSPISTHFPIYSGNSLTFTR